MMGFEFPDSKVDLEIEGETYTVDVGDVATQDAIQQMLAGVTENEILEAVQNGDLGFVGALDAAIRESLRTVLGDKTYDAVVADRRPNLLEDMSLVQYVNERIQESKQTDRINELYEQLDITAAWTGSAIGEDEDDV